MVRAAFDRGPAAGIWDLDSAPSSPERQPYVVTLDDSVPCSQVRHPVVSGNMVGPTRQQWPWRQLELRIYTVDAYLAPLHRMLEGSLWVDALDVSVDSAVAVGSHDPATVVSVMLDGSYVAGASGVADSKAK